MDRERVLVTGAYGYVGGMLCSVLEREYSVIRAGRGDFDYGRPGSVREFLRTVRPDRIVHLAAVCETGDLADYYAVNVCGLYHLLRSCADEGIRHFTFASGNNVYPADCRKPHSEEEACAPDGENPYGISKYVGELLIRDILDRSGTAYCILRIGDIYGPGQRYGNLMKTMVSRALQGRTLQIFGQGVRTRDYIYIQDAADGIAFASGRELAGIYNLSTGTGTSVAQLAGTIASLAGADVRTEHVECAREDTSCVILDGEKLRRAGFTAEISVREGMRRIIEREREKQIWGK